MRAHGIIRNIFCIVITIFSMIHLISCSMDHGNPEIAGSENKSHTISGTVSSGSPVAGTVYLKNATTGEILSGPIDENGHYSILLINYMTGPYILEARGTTGGRAICLHSLGTRADVSATVNITPMTEMICGNVLKSDPELFFESFDEDVLSKAATAVNISKHENIIKKRFKNIMDLFEIPDDLSLINTPFYTDHSGIDGVLDVIRFNIVLDETGKKTPQMVAKLIFSDDQILDDYTEDDDSGFPVQQVTVKDIASIAAVFKTWENKFNDESSDTKRLPLSSDSDLTVLFADDFFQNGRNRTEFLEKICTFDDGLVTGTLEGMRIIGLSYDYIDFSEGIAQVSFTVKNNKGYTEDQYHWTMVKSGEQWRMKGNRQLVDCYVGVYSAYSITTKKILANGFSVFAWTPFIERASDIHHIGVTGYGIPSGYTLTPIHKGGGLLFVASGSAPEGYCEFADAETVRDNEEYVFTLYGNDGNTIPGSVYKRCVKKGCSSSSDLSVNKLLYFSDIVNPLQTEIDTFNDGPAKLESKWTTANDMVRKEISCYYTHSSNNAIKRKIYPLNKSGETEYDFMIFEKNITRLDIYARSSDIYDRVFDAFISDSQYVEQTMAKDIIFYLEEVDKPFRIF